MTTRVISIAAIAAIGVVAIAQSTSSSNSSSNTRQGGGSASGSASASSSGRGSSSGSQNGNGFGSGGGSGSMAIPNYALMLTRARGTGERPIPREIWEQEVNYWQDLARQGFVTLAGNWREWDGGLVLLNVGSDQQAERIANGDPGVKQGIFSYTLKAWEVRVVGAPRDAGNIGTLIGPNGLIRGGGNGSNSGGGGGNSNSGSNSNSGGGNSNSGSNSNSGGGNTRRGGK